MLPHQSTIHSTEILAHAQFYEEVLNITGDKDVCPLVGVLVQDAHERNISVNVFQMHSESQISNSTQQVLVDGLAWTESNTSSSICTLSAITSACKWNECTCFPQNVVYHCTRLLGCFWSGYQHWYSLNATTTTNAVHEIHTGIFCSGKSCHLVMLITLCSHQK
jgi:hypothetical protein